MLSSWRTLSARQRREVNALHLNFLLTRDPLMDRGLRHHLSGRRANIRDLG
jgi:hypothetical protein